MEMLWIGYDAQLPRQQRISNRIEDGGCRHFEFRKAVVISELSDQSIKILSGKVVNLI